MSRTTAQQPALPGRPGRPRSAAPTDPKATVRLTRELLPLVDALESQLRMPRGEVCRRLLLGALHLPLGLTRADLPLEPTS